MYLVLAGEIELIDGIATNDERIISVRSAGELLGEMSVFQSIRQHRFMGRVRADTQILVLPRAELDTILRREPLLAYELLRIAQKHLHRTHRRATRVLEEKNQELLGAYTALEYAQARLIVQERLQHELRLAREIQEQMLPVALPDLPSIDLAARMIPAHEVGGDFYDVFRLDEETLGLAIGDVCGKGMPAALYMAQTRSLIRATAEQRRSPDAVLGDVNTHLRAMNSGGMFVTVIYATLHGPTQTLTLARAGHDYPLLATTNGLEVLAVAATGQPLGILPHPVFDLQVRVLAPGDIVVLYTDGITEAINAEGQFFGQDRLQTIVSDRYTYADSLCDHVLQSAAIFQGLAPQQDDMTLLVVRVACD